MASLAVGKPPKAGDTKTYLSAEIAEGHSLSSDGYGAYVHGIDGMVYVDFDRFSLTPYPDSGYPSYRAFELDIPGVVTGLDCVSDPHSQIQIFDAHADLRETRLADARIDCGDEYTGARFILDYPPYKDSSPGDPTAKCVAVAYAAGEWAFSATADCPPKVYRDAYRKNNLIGAFAATFSITAFPLP